MRNLYGRQLAWLHNQMKQGHFLECRHFKTIVQHHKCLLQSHISVGSHSLEMELF